jgi:NADPH:quinone reductase-like Zn-dependent oxidoreductase
MKAVVIHQYGGPEVLSFEEYPDLIPGAAEVQVRVAATSINPFDIMRRSDSAKDLAPIKFPGVVGVAINGSASAIVTFNQRDFAAGIKGFSCAVILPAMALQQVRSVIP